MSWKAFGKFLFFAGLGIFVFNEIHLQVFSAYYGGWFSDEMVHTTAHKIFQWTHDFRFAINGVFGGWPTLMIVGGGLWVGGRKTSTT